MYKGNFKKIISLLLVISLVLPTINMYAANNLDNSKKSANYIVKFKSEIAKDSYTKNPKNTKKVSKKFNKNSAVVMELTSVEKEQLLMSSEILFIEEDAEINTLSIDQPSKSSTPVKNMKNGTQEAPWGIKYIGADQTLKKYSGKNVNVAIFDTGVSSHEDLKVSGGISFVDYTSSYADDNGHGTHVAGIIAAQDNKLGVVGVAPNAKIYSVKILNQNGSGNYSNIISAIEWAIDNNIDVINMSVGGNVDSIALHEAVQNAVNSGIIIVAAAGNKGAGNDTMLYPAKYPEVVSVGALDENNQVAYYSSRGPELKVVAPGTSVLSTINDGTYATMSGTSMAAPHVTGAIAALKSKNSKFTSEEIVNSLYISSTELGNKSDYGYGVVNLAKATEVSKDDIVKPIPVPSPKPTPTSSTDPKGTPDLEKPTIEAREKYLQLVEADTYGAIVDKFHELYGDNYTADEIENNFSTIFGLPASEIDEGILDILINAHSNDNLEIWLAKQIDMESASTSMESLSIRKFDKAPEKTILERPEPIPYNQQYSDEQTDIVTGSAVTLDDSGAQSEEVNAMNSASNSGFTSISLVSLSSTSIVVDIWFKSNTDGNNLFNMYDPVSGSWSYLLGRDDKPDATSQRYTINNLEPGAVYQLGVTTYDWGTSSWKDSVIYVQTTPNPISFDVTAVGSDYFTVEVSYPCDYVWGRGLNFYDPIYGIWRPVTGHPNYYVNSGTYTLAGLVPGVKYTISYDLYNDTTGLWTSLYKDVTTDSEPETLSSSYTPNFKFSFEPIDIELFQGTNYTTWKNRMQKVYEDMYELVGSKPYNGTEIEIKSTRTQIPNNWMQSGNPILFNRKYVPDQIQKINQLDDWSFGIMYAIGQDFNSYKWNFSSEFWANFKAYYSTEKNNAKLYVGGTVNNYTGAFLKYYYKSENDINYDNTLAKGIYHHDGLTYKFIDIKDKIGWEPFKKTFRFFNELSYENVPTTNIGKFNLFITKLKEYSNVDVLSQFTANEKNAIQSNLGGTIAYVIMPTAASIYLNTPIDATVTQGNFALYKFTTSQAGSYTITTSPYNGGTTSSDTYLNLYSDANLGTKLSENDDYNGTIFSQIKYDLNANTTYYIKLSGYANTAISTSLIVNKPPDVWHKIETENDTIYIKEPTDDSSPLEARIVNDMNSTYIYRYSNGTWNNTYLIASVPSGITVSSLQAADELYTSSIVDDIIVDIKKQADALISGVGDALGYDGSYIQVNDLAYVYLGIQLGIVDTVYPDFLSSGIKPNSTNIYMFLIDRSVVKGLILSVIGKTEYELSKDYYFISAKTQTEFIIRIASTVSSATSYAAAITALANAGISLQGGIYAFAGSGGTAAVPALVITTEAVASLAASGVLQVAGVAFSKISDSADSAFKSDNSILQKNTEAWGDGGMSSVEANINKHFEKHYIEVGAKNLQDYMRKAAAYRDTVIRKGINFNTPRGGATDNVYRQYFNKLYIDLEVVEDGVYRIISYGRHIF